MNAQDLAALAVVAVAAALLARWLMKWMRGTLRGGCPGCGTCGATRKINDYRRAAGATAAHGKEQAS